MVSEREAAGVCGATVGDSNEAFALHAAETSNPEHLVTRPSATTAAIGCDFYLCRSGLSGSGLVTTKEDEANWGTVMPVKAAGCEADRLLKPKRRVSTSPMDRRASLCGGGEERPRQRSRGTSPQTKKDMSSLSPSRSRHNDSPRSVLARALLRTTLGAAAAGAAAGAASAAVAMAAAARATSPSQSSLEQSGESLR